MLQGCQEASLLGLRGQGSDRVKEVAGAPGAGDSGDSEFQADGKTLKASKQRMSFVCHFPPASQQGPLETGRSLIQQM